jgi:hypothetical protein
MTIPARVTDKNDADYKFVSQGVRGKASVSE